MAGHRLSTTLLACGVLGLAACSGDNAVGPGTLRVTVALQELNGPDVSYAGPGPGDQLVQCDLTLRAAAVGSGRVTWSGATLLFFAGPDRRSALDTIQIAQTEIQQAWGGPDIGAGEAPQSRWMVSASIPFSATLLFHYRTTSGGQQSARVSFDCGPPIPSFPTLPRLDLKTITPSGGDIDVNGQIAVQYAAESDYGLWTNGVRLTGPCVAEQTIAELLVRQVERTVSLAIPASCGVGASLALEVVATDAALQTRTVRPLDHWRIVDHTPPQVYADHLPAASAYVFAGDTVRPFIAATDNQSVQFIIWEIRPGGVRDSIAGAGGRYVDIPIKPEWSGTRIQFRVFARDAAGLVSDTLVAPSGGVPIYPTSTAAVRSTAINDDVAGVEFDSPRNALYFLQWQNAAAIGVFSLTSMTLTETIPLQTLPFDMDMSVSGDSLLLVLPYSKALGIIDLGQATKSVSLVPLRSLDTLPTLSAGSVRVGANGKAYVRLDGPAPGAARRVEVDVSTQTERWVAGPADLSGARFERSFDRSALLFSQGSSLLLRYDMASGGFTPIHSTPSGYGPLRVDATGNRVTLGLDVFDGNLDFLRRVAGIYGGEAIPGAALSRDGNYLYQALGYRGVGRARTSDGTVVDRFRIPFSASGFLKVSPDGNWLIVIDSFLNTAQIALIDLR